MASVANTQEDIVKVVVRALQAIDVKSLDIWSELASLSNDTEVEAIEVPDEGVIIQPENRFSAVLNLYLLLNYNEPSDDRFTTSDSVRAVVNGHLVDNVPVIVDASVDVSSFSDD